MFVAQMEGIEMTNTADDGGGGTKSVSNIIAAAGVAATAILGYISYDLSERNSELAQAASRFDASVESGALVLRGEGSVYAEPTSLTVEPIFDILDGSAVRAEAVPIALNTGNSDRNEQQLVFSDIVKRICAYGGNRSRCSKQTPSQIRVTFSVNGIKDTDDVIVR